MTLPETEHKPRGPRTDVIVIGAGHAGLSVSYLLKQRGIRHVVLERGEIGNSWNRERWDSFRLLTPNWRVQLPGFRYDGGDPEGFMDAVEFTNFLKRYALENALPVVTGAAVQSLRKTSATFSVRANASSWDARAVVMASGAFNRPKVPAVAKQLPSDLRQLTAFGYRAANSLLPGGVLVVGASSTGMQLADELARSGRAVTIAVGEHVRMPRRYRGRDIFYWLNRSGIHDQRYDEIDDLTRGRNLPSPQLVGRDLPELFDLNHLRSLGVRITGKLAAVEDRTLRFSGGLHNVCAMADQKLRRVLKEIDAVADREGAPRGKRIPPTELESSPPLTIELERRGIRNVIWATGFAPDYSWLGVPVLDRKGQLLHDGGVVACPGLYALGLPLLRRRKSSFIFGIEDDANDIIEHLAAYLDKQFRRERHELYHDSRTIERVC
ncbi:MAG: NAD(P)-binding domain-containing protein [Pseudomonadota bacterium]